VSLANDLLDETMLENNMQAIPVFEENKKLAEPLWKELTKQEEKIQKAMEAGKKPSEKATAKLEELQKQFDELVEKTPEFDSTVSTLKVYDQMEQRYGLNRVQAAKAIARQGGLKPAAGFEELVSRERAMAKKLNTYDGDGENVHWLAGLVRPVANVVSDRVGKVVGKKFEAAFETSARNQELRMMRYLSNPTVSDEVRRWADQEDVKRMFLDLSYVAPETKKGLTLKEATAQIRSHYSTLSKEGREMVETLIKDSVEQQKEARRLYREDVLKDGLYWASSKKRDETESISALSTRQPSKSLDGNKIRTRRSAYDMELEELETYQNPFVVQLQRMAQEENLLQLARQYNMRPSMKINDNTTAFFDELERKFASESGSTDKGRVGRELIEDTFLGAKSRPPKAVELFMKQAYGGTLGQLDSAILNVHDVAVSMLTSGVRPTLDALMQRGFDPRPLGIANSSKSLGEFKEGFDNVMQRSALEKVVDGYLEASFKWSGFRDMDRFGKGVVLKAAWNGAQRSAKKGTLIQDFGYMMDPRDLTKINAVLKRGDSLESMTPQQRELVTQLMFTRLGEQQLISAAGRPLAYLKNPQFRFMYALTGFAIKQAELMKKGMLDAAKKGQYVEAGKFFGKYMMTAGLGYGLVNQFRGSLQYAMGNEDKQPTLAGFALDVLSQPVSAVTYNRLGDAYSWNQFKNNPVDYALESLVPPSGLVGNLGKDVYKVLGQHEFPTNTLRSVPGGDELKALIDN